MKGEDPFLKKAVALKYDQEKDHAPVIVAKGKGTVAEKIIALGEQHGVYIHKDPKLVQILAALDINREIPEELYTVVAEILALVYRLDEEWPVNKSNS